MKRNAFLIFNDVELMTGAFYGEARGKERSDVDEIFEFIGIGNVILNRKDDVKHRFPRTVKEVILQPQQFSCFNDDDKNSDVVYFFLRNRSPLAYFERMKAIAISVQFYLTKDVTKGAVNYTSTAFYEKHKNEVGWWSSMEPSFSAGGTTFLIPRT